MPTPKKDFDDIRRTMGAKSAKSFVEASARTSALKKKMNDGYAKGMKKSPKTLEIMTVDNRKNKGKFGTDRVAPTKIHATRNGISNREHI